MRTMYFADIHLFPSLSLPLVVNLFKQYIKLIISVWEHTLIKLIIKRRNQVKNTNNFNLHLKYSPVSWIMNAQYFLIYKQQSYIPFIDQGKKWHRRNLFTFTENFRFCFNNSVLIYILTILDWFRISSFSKGHN